MPITKQEALNEFGGHEHPNLEQLEQKTHAIRQAQFPLNSLITEEKVQETKRMLDRIHECYAILNPQEASLTPPIVLPFKFLLTAQFLESIKAIKNFDISFLNKINEYPFSWDPTLNILSDRLKTKNETIRRLCGTLFNTECAPTRQSEETQTNLLLLISALEDFQACLGALCITCGTVSRSEYQNEAQIFFNNYRAFLQQQLSLSILSEALQVRSSRILSDSVPKNLRDEMKKEEETRLNLLHETLKTVSSAFEEYSEKYKKIPQDAEHETQRQGLFQEYLAILENPKKFKKASSTQAANPSQPPVQPVVQSQGITPGTQQQVSQVTSTTGQTKIEQPATSTAKPEPTKESDAQKPLPKWLRYLILSVVFVGTLGIYPFWKYKQTQKDRKAVSDFNKMAEGPKKAAAKNAIPDDYFERAKFSTSTNFLIKVQVGLKMQCDGSRKAAKGEVEGPETGVPPTLTAQFGPKPRK